MDIGCSSGGFCDVLIKEKAKKIYAIDVGYGQFDWNLKKKEIILFEKTNARYLNKKMIPEIIDLIVCDVSFISAKKVLEPNIKLLGKNFEIIVLLNHNLKLVKNLLEEEELLKTLKYTKIYVKILVFGLSNISNQTFVNSSKVL